MRAHSRKDVPFSAAFPTFVSPNWPSRIPHSLDAADLVSAWNPWVEASPLIRDQITRDQKRL